MKKLFLLFTSLFIFSLTTFSLAPPTQYSIKEEERNILTKWELKKLQKAIDYQLAFFNRVFPDSMIDKSSVNVTVFNNYTKYLVFQEKLSGGYIRPNSSGFYSPANKEVIVCKDKYEESFLNACYHELSHFFIASRMNCMVAFLMQNEETMIAVINNIYNGKSSYEALENSYNGGFAAFERDFIQKYSHIIPVFHTLNAGDVKLEENTTYVGGEINKHLLTQDGFDLFSQHSIKDEESVLTKKENQILQKVIDYQLEFYNRAFPDSTIKKSSVKLTVFNNRNDYIDYVAYNEGKNREDVQSTAGFYSTKNKEVRIF